MGKTKKTIEKTEQTKELTKNDEMDYILDHLDRMNEDLKKISIDIDLATTNANFACEQLENTLSDLKRIKERLGL